MLLLFSSPGFRLENRPKIECAAGHEAARPMIFRRAATDFAGFPSVPWYRQQDLHRERSRSSPVPLAGVVGKPGKSEPRG